MISTPLRFWADVYAQAVERVCLGGIGVTARGQDFDLRGAASINSGKDHRKMSSMSWETY